MTVHLCIPKFHRLKLESQLLYCLVVEATEGEQEAATVGVVWVQVRVKRRRHAASQGFDAGAKPSQHWRSPKHSVSEQEPKQRALEWGGSRLSAVGVGKEPYAGRWLTLQAAASGTLREGFLRKGN